MENKNQQLIICSIYLSGDKGINIFDIKRVLNQKLTSDEIMKLIDKINENWKNNSLVPFQIKKYGILFKISTPSYLFEDLSKIVKVEYISFLTPMLTEILAIVAYNHPNCTRSIIEKIRNSDPSSGLSKLTSFNLIEVNTQNKDKRSVKYKLTQKSFDIFGITSINELPKISKNFDQNFNESNIIEEENEFYDS